MKKQKKFIVGAAIIFLFGFVCVTTAKADEYGLDTAAQEAELPKVSSLTTYAGNIIGAGLSMVSVVFFVLMLYAGIRWMVARGNEEEETKARDMIIGAVIGMVIIMASYALTTFVFRGSTGGQVPKATPIQTGIKSPPQKLPSEQKCSIKSGATENCQKKIVDAWVAIHPDDSSKTFSDLLSQVPEFSGFMTSKCNEQADCEISKTIGICVSFGVSVCPLINNPTECNGDQSNICEWK